MRNAVFLADQMMDTDYASANDMARYIGEHCDVTLIMGGASSFLHVQITNRGNQTLRKVGSILLWLSILTFAGENATTSSC